MLLAAWHGMMAPLDPMALLHQRLMAWALPRGVGVLLVVEDGVGTRAAWEVVLSPLSAGEVALFVAEFRPSETRTHPVQ